MARLRRGMVRRRLRRIKSGQVTMVGWILDWNVIECTGDSRRDVRRLNPSGGNMTQKPTRQKVYVAGPYTQGDVARNVRNAFEAATDLADRGFAPFVPHSTHFWHMLFPQPYEFWIELDLRFLPACDAVLRLPGPSSGADKEIARAGELNIPVFASASDLDRYFGPGGRQNG